MARPVEMVGDFPSYFGSGMHRATSPVTLDREDVDILAKSLGSRFPNDASPSLISAISHKAPPCADTAASATVKQCGLLIFIFQLLDLVMHLPPRRSHIGALRSASALAILSHRFLISSSAKGG
jgi:hypothetical protein